MKVYVINLKEAKDRRNSIAAQLHSAGLSYELFEAINGRALSDKELAERVDMEEVHKHPEWLTRGMLGAALSHMEVYSTIANSGSDWSLILEDDVILCPEIKNILNHVEQHPGIYRNSLNLLYTLSRYGPVKLSREPVQSAGSYHFHRLLNKIPGGAGAYIIHRDIAKRFLGLNEKIKVAPDAWSYFLERKVFSGIHCIYPFAAKPGLFESTIGYVNEHTLIYRIKHFVEVNKLFPFYAALKWNRNRIWKKTSNIIFE